MPNPFPGMNPYLESPLFWAGVHDGLIFTLNGALNAALPPGFVARMGERGKDEARNTFVEVIQPNLLNRVVTLLEILSYSNKTATGPDRQAYLSKQKRLLTSDVNLLEIDLLRGGEPTLALSPACLAELSGKRYDYAVCLHRAGAGGSQFEAWTRTVRRPLPRLSVPLTLYLPDVTIDLQSLLNHVYEAGAHNKIIDYLAPPEPPLRKIDAEWADELLRQNNLRFSNNLP